MDNVIAQSTHRDKMNKTQGLCPRVKYKAINVLPFCLLLFLQNLKYFICIELLVSSSVGLSSKNLSLITSDRQGDNLCALSWAMMKFLKPASRVRNHAINMINSQTCADMLCYVLLF